MKRTDSRVLFALMLLAISASALIRWRLLGTPLERDEGEYAYMATFLLRGLSPYTHAYSMKLPGIYAAYALIMKVFGETRSSIHGGLLVMNTLTSFLVFLLARRLFGMRAGCVAGAAFAIVSLNTHLHGITANSEHFVIFFAVAGLYLLLRATEAGSGLLHYFSGGLLLGMGVMMKQHGLFFLLTGVVYVPAVLIMARQGRVGRAILRASIVLAGGLVPFGLSCLLIYLQGGFEKFWFWTFTYSRLYVSSPPLGAGMRAFYMKFSPIFLTTFPFWVFAAIGAVFTGRRGTAPGAKVFCALFTVFSALSIMPGLYFREHYFVLLLPAASMLAGFGVERVCGPSGKRPWATAMAVVLTLVLTLPGLFMERSALFMDSPERVSRRMFGMNPFPEALEVARYIRENSTGDDTIAVLGSEPEIYFYSRRASATPYIYAYPLMEYQGRALSMQKEMIGDIEEKRPRFIVYVDIYNSWLRGRRSVGLIFDWFRFYWPGRYREVGLVEITPGGTSYVFGDEVSGRGPLSPYSMTIYRREDGV